MTDNVPWGLVPGNFEGTILRTLHLSLLEIIAYLRELETQEERFLVAEAIGVIIANNLTEGGLEFHNEYERIVARIPMGLTSAVENITNTVIEFERGRIRRAMFGIVMRMLGSVVLER